MDVELEKDMKDIEKINLILDKYDILYDEYMRLIEDREEIKIKYVKKNKKDIILNSFILFILTIMLFYFVNLNMIEIFKLFPNICKYGYIGLFLLSVGGESYLLFNKLLDCNIIYDGIEEDESYKLVLDKIKEKEKQIKKVEEEYIDFNNDLEDDLKYSYNCNEDSYENIDNLEIDNKCVLVRKRVKDNN